MIYKLYYVDGTASMGIRVLLEEIGASYELIQTTTDRRKPRPAEQLKLNPNGWVPVLLWDDSAMYECAAITIFLCDRHSEVNLAPAINAPERSLFLQTLVYFSSSIHTAFQLDFHAYRFADTPENEPSAQRRGCRRLRETWQVIDDQIGDKQWILGDQFSAADVAATPDPIVPLCRPNDCKVASIADTAVNTSRSHTYPKCPMRNTFPLR